MQPAANNDRSETVQIIIRHAPWTNRPHSPRQALWKGHLPPGVTEITTRDALDKHLRETYAHWARNFALLSDEFIALAVKNSHDRVPRRWETYPWVDCCSCQIGDDFLWLQKQARGWTVELCYPDQVDPDARILAIQNMPVLCPDAPGAAWLAQACYPEPVAKLDGILIGDGAARRSDFGVILRTIARRDC
jgi:hypothetical protein